MSYDDRCRRDGIVSISTIQSHQMKTAVSRVPVSGNQALTLFAIIKICCKTVGRRLRASCATVFRIVAFQRLFSISAY